MAPFTSAAFVEGLVVVQIEMSDPGVPSPTGVAAGLGTLGVAFSSIFLCASNTHFQKQQGYP